MKPTAIIYFENGIYDLIKHNDAFQFDSSYYSSPEFTARPNSTLRLNIVNFKALKELSECYPIDLYHLEEIESSVASLMKYEKVVVNTVSAKRVVDFLELLFSTMARTDSPPEVVIGTEYSWKNKVATGDVTEEMVEQIYTNHTLLRHTARTDRHIYEPEWGKRARVQEFEIGLDLEPMPSAADNERRSGVLFVAAPEGRKTKNNNEIDLIVEELKNRKMSPALPIDILRPPYTTSEYWRRLASAKYLVFTSLGETFSYVLNEALAMGVVAIRRPELFATRTSRFGADSYWDVGLRYQSVEDAVDLLERFESDDYLYRLESQRATRISRERFSLDAIKQNWFLLLNDASLNTNSLLLMDVSLIDGGVDSALDIARDLDCDVAMAYMSRGLDTHDLSSYSYVSQDRSQALLPYCYKESSDRLRLIGPNASFGRFDNEPTSDTVADYLRLIVRTNKVRKIFVDSSISDPVLDDALNVVDYLEGSTLVPVWVEKIDIV